MATELTCFSADNNLKIICSEIMHPIYEYTYFSIPSCFSVDKKYIKISPGVYFGFGNCYKHLMQHIGQLVSTNFPYCHVEKPFKLCSKIWHIIYFQKADLFNNMAIYLTFIYRNSNSRTKKITKYVELEQVNVYKLIVCERKKVQNPANDFEHFLRPYYQS